MSTQTQTTQLYLSQARKSLNSKDCMSIYDKWAETYNTELADEAQDYVAPVLVAKTALEASRSNLAKAVILDAGCGTGLVGQALALSGAKIIDGIDLSLSMLRIANQTGVYRKTSQADMNRSLDQADELYDIVTCVGTFTAGHVGPDPALRELIRVTKRGGIVAATILEEIWETQGFKNEVEVLKQAQLVTVVSSELVDYVKGHGDKAVLLVLEKVSPSN